MSADDIDVLAIGAAPTHPPPARRPVRVGDRLGACGDDRDIQGALVSGRRTAAALPKSSQ